MFELTGVRLSKERHLSRACRRSSKRRWTNTTGLIDWLVCIARRLGLASRAWRREQPEESMTTIYAYDATLKEGAPYINGTLFRFVIYTAWVLQSLIVNVSIFLWPIDDSILHRAGELNQYIHNTTLRVVDPCDLLPPPQFEILSILETDYELMKDEIQKNQIHLEVAQKGWKKARATIHHAKLSHQRMAVRPRQQIHDTSMITTDLQVEQSHNKNTEQEKAKMPHRRSNAVLIWHEQTWRRIASPWRLRTAQYFFNVHQLRSYT